MNVIMSDGRIRRGTTLSIALSIFVTGLGMPARPVLADMLLVDRGLPSGNLNAAAGADRSNWSVGYGTSSFSNPEGGDFYYSMADSFSVGDPFAGADVNITGIRLWVVEYVTGFGSFDYTSSSSYKLLLGNQFALAPVTASLSVSSVLYENGTNYQTPSGIYRELIQLDFVVNETVSANSTLFVGLAGSQQGGAYINPYAHASNAGLSESTQDGADGITRIFVGASTNLNTWSSYDGWEVHPETGFSDKPADMNMQVFVVPEPTSILIVVLGSLLLTLVSGRRRHSPANNSPTRVGESASGASPDPWP